MTRRLLCLLGCVLALGCADADGIPGTFHSGSDAGAAPPPEDEADRGDMFDDVGTNPFVETAHDPFSTFGADVDTASYDIFVRDAEDGITPNPLSVRLEEYVNFFNYDYPAPEPDAEVPFAIDLDASAHPMGRQLAHLRIGIQASEPYAFEKRPTNLVFLIDTSGSMGAEDKLPLAQHLMRESLAVLADDDTVSIVTYAGSVSVALPPTNASETRRIERAIDRLNADGGTAGGAGIQLAYEQAEEAFREGGFNHVVLCTDGDFNIGISDSDELVELIEEKRETGITLTAVGFGRGNLNDAMMERVTNAGNGIYNVLSSPEQATRYAEEKLLRTIRHVARDLKIQLELNPEHVVAYRLLGYENRAIADTDFRNDAIDAGDIGAGHRVTALYELVLSGQSIPMAEGAPEATTGEPVEGEREIDPAELVRVKVRWKDPGASVEDPAYETSDALLPEDIASLTEADEDLLWASAIAAFAEILKDSPYADVSDLARIDMIVRPQASRDEDRARFVELFDSIRGLLE